MTREELRENIAEALRPYGLLTFEAKPAADDILALLNRYEQERWSNEPPTEYHEVLICEALEFGQRYIAVCSDYTPDEPWPPYPRFTGRWYKIELPPGPEGEK